MTNRSTTRHDADENPSPLLLPSHPHISLGSPPCPPHHGHTHRPHTSLTTSPPCPPPRPQAISWLDVFETWKAVGSRVGSLVGSSKESVAKQFGKFLDDPEFGAPFKRDVRCSGPSTSKCGGLKSSRLHLMTDLATGANIVTFIPGMARVKAICAKWRAKGLKVQPFSDGFLYLERLQVTGYHRHRHDHHHHHHRNLCLTCATPLRS